MTIRYTCGSCGSVLKIKDELAGTPGKCPKCKNEFTVPSVAAESEASPATASAALEEGVDRVPADEEFDPVAFLMAEGGGRPQAAPTAVPPPPTLGAKLPGTSDPPARRPIRGDDNGSSAPRRASGGPATAAETADAMLRTNASSNAKELLTRTMEESRVRAAQMPDEDRGKPGIDFQQLWQELGYKIVPMAGGVVLLIVGALWFGWYMAGGGRDLPDLARVSGTVTKAGAPLAGAEVWFTPMDVKSKGSHGYTNAEGEYTQYFDEDAEGAVLGKNRVEVILLDDHGRNIIEGEFSMAKPGQFEVKPGSSEFDIKIP